MSQKRIFAIVSLFIFNLFSLLYLLSPDPVLEALPSSVKSDLPGDTVQIENVSAYFTNLTRTEIINHYKATYNNSLRIILNHPPEKARTIFVDTIQSYFLEEFSIPFKQSLYINGFEWENDVFTATDSRSKNKLIYNGKEYKTKVTLRLFPVSPKNRLISFFTFELGLIIIAYLYRSVLTAKKT